VNGDGASNSHDPILSGIYLDYNHHYHGDYVSGSAAPLLDDDLD
jgi:hypothetical protein